MASSLGKCVIPRVFYGWIEDLLEPFVHFIPLKGDLSDILEAPRLAATKDPTELSMLANVSQNAKQLSDRLSYASVVHHFALAVNRLTELRKALRK